MADVRAAVAAELERLREENARLLRFLKLRPRQAAPPGHAQAGYFEAPRACAQGLAAGGARRWAHGAPAPAARPADPEPGLIIWLVSAGLVIDTGTLSVISWAEHEHTLTIARTMGVVTFSLLNLFFSIEAKDERQSAFSLDTFSDRTFIITTGVSFFLLVMSTVLRPFQTILKTTTLDVRQWLLCTAVALSIIVAAETRKAVRRADRP